MKLLMVLTFLLSALFIGKNHNVIGSYRHMQYDAVYMFNLNADSTVEYGRLGCRYNLEKIGKWYFKEDTLVVHFTKYAYLDTNMIEKYLVYGKKLVDACCNDKRYGYVR